MGQQPPWQRTSPRGITEQVSPNPCLSMPAIWSAMNSSQTTWCGMCTGIAYSKVWEHSFSLTDLTALPMTVNWTQHLVPYFMPLDQLQLQGGPAVVLYAWSTALLYSQEAVPTALRFKTSKTIDRAMATISHHNHCWDSWALGSYGRRIQQANKLCPSFIKQCIWNQSFLFHQWK